MFFGVYDIDIEEIRKKNWIGIYSWFDAILIFYHFDEPNINSRKDWNLFNCHSSILFCVGRARRRIIYSIWLDSFFMLHY